MEKIVSSPVAVTYRYVFFLFDPDNVDELGPCYGKWHLTSSAPLLIGSTVRFATSFEEESSATVGSVVLHLHEDAEEPFVSAIVHCSHVAGPLPIDGLEGKWEMNPDE